MTILSTVQQAAPKLGLTVPTVVFGSTERTMVEMQALVNEAAQQISDDHDWSKLKAIATITGDGSDTDFALPSDYDRMVKDAELWSSANTTVPLVHVLSLNDWLAMEVQGFDFPYGGWIEYGGEINIKPARANAETVKYAYIKNTRVSPSVGDDKALFTADTDTFVLNERVLKLAIIWKWKEAKGTDYQEDIYNYTLALAKDVGRDKGNTTIAVGGWKRSALNTNTAYPYPLGS